MLCKQVQIERVEFMSKQALGLVAHFVNSNRKTKTLRRVSDLLKKLFDSWVGVNVGGQSAWKLQELDLVGATVTVVQCCCCFTMSPRW